MVGRGFNAQGGKLVEVHISFALIVEDQDILLKFVIESMIFPSIMAKTSFLLQILFMLLLKILIIGIFALI